jgi:hypothetical protein
MHALYLVLHYVVWLGLTYTDYWSSTLNPARTRRQYPMRRSDGLCKQTEDFVSVNNPIRTKSRLLARVLLLS